ncbi:filamentous hemagglutinin family domain-containing protein [Candidatus Magnetomorum sp. HK-1]|nr:filamentous hemagglutinin family domain-containing protein [Candidatus Magnetomorum sp. HK-1]
MSKKNILLFLLMCGLTFQPSLFWNVISTNAEIITDQSFGNARTVESINNVYTIDDTLGTQKGTNLFHSFDTFNLEAGTTALFSGSVNVERIISRVTGGESSLINGTISSSIQGADLFFLNPNGIIFGASAQLNIDGSFYPSTADYLQLGQTKRFITGSVDTGGIVSSPPHSFGFIDTNIAPIEFHASGKGLVDDDTSLSSMENSFGVHGENQFCIIGGKITIDQGAVLSIKDKSNEGTSSSLPDENYIKGSIQIISIKSASNVYFQEQDLNFSKVTAFDDILISDHSQLNVSGHSAGNIKLAGQDIVFDQSICASDNYGSLNGGKIDIVGENIILKNIAKITADTHDDGNASSIILSARSDVVLVDFNTYIQSFSGTQEKSNISGETGNISIHAKNIFITEGGRILNRSYSLGNCSDITLEATETIALSSKEKPYDPSSIFLDTYRKNVQSGDAGTLSLKAKNIYLSEGAKLSASTRGSGKGGSIILEAHEDVHLYGEWVFKNKLTPQNGCRIYVRTYADMLNAGDSGNVTIRAKNITMEGGASIQAETSSTGSGGNVTLFADENIILQGDSGKPSPTVIDLSCVTYVSDNIGKGDAGDLRMTAKNITIKNGAWINTQTDSLGNAGNIWIEAEKLTVSGEGGPYKEAVDIGKETITSAIVSSATEGSNGNGGNIDIQAGVMLLSDGAYIQTSTKSIGNAGEIKIHHTGTITLMGISRDNQSSYIESNTYAGNDFKHEKTGDGGIVSIDAASMNLLDGSRISTSAIALKNGTGKAGDIFINLTDTLQMSNQNKNTTDLLGKGSGIYARSRQENQSLAGAAGKINLSAGTIFMNDNALISTSTNGLENAGDIDVQTKNSIYLSLSKIASESTMPFTNDKNGGAAGTITVHAGKDIRMIQSSHITTDGVSSGGGKINIYGGKALTILNSDITTNVNQGSGNGGDISIKNDFTIMNHGIISANADAGDGGAIFIYTQHLIQSTDSKIEATSKRGNDGTVEIQTPDMDLSDNLLNLSGNFLNTVNVVKTLCEKISGQDSIQIVIHKPYGIPDSSDTWYNFSAYEPIKLLSQTSFDELDKFDNISNNFSDDVLFQNLSNEIDRK